MQSEGDRSSDRIRSASLRKRATSSLDVAASAPIIATMLTTAARTGRRGFHFINLATIPAPLVDCAVNPSLPHTSLQCEWSTVTHRRVKRGSLREIDGARTRTNGGEVVGNGISIKSELVQHCEQAIDFRFRVVMDQADPQETALAFQTEPFR
jgi:hypothetical protein